MQLHKVYDNIAVEFSPEPLPHFLVEFDDEMHKFNVKELTNALHFAQAKGLQLEKTVYCLFDDEVIELQ